MPPYTVDELDAVSRLGGVPRPASGAPSPHVVADEHRLCLAYVGAKLPDAHTSPVIFVVDPRAQPPTLVLVEFTRCLAFYQGPPNDPAFAGHPLAGRGLQPYGAFEITRSSWIRALERANRMHPHRGPDAYERLTHFVFTFHDSAFECVAEHHTVSVRSAVAPAEVLREMLIRPNATERATG